MDIVVLFASASSVYLHRNLKIFPTMQVGLVFETACLWTPETICNAQVSRLLGQSSRLAPYTPLNYISCDFSILENDFWGMDFAVLLASAGI